MNGIRFHKKLRFRLVLFYLLIILFGTAASEYLSLRAAERELKDLLDNQFRSTMNITENFIDVIGQSALIWANYISSDQGLRDELERGDMAGLSRRVAALMQRTSADNVMVLDGSGQVIARGDGAAGYDRSLITTALVKKAVNDNATGTSIFDEGDHFTIYSSGILYGRTGKKAGVLLVGYEINNRFIDNIKKNTSIDLAIVRDRAVMATTFYEDRERVQTLPVPYLEYQMLLNSRDGSAAAEFLGKRYLITAKNLRRMEPNKTGSMLLAYSQDSLLSIRKSLSRRYFIIFIAGFVIAVLLWVHISKRILHPINKLVRVTDRISHGDLDANVEVRTGDEFEVLAEHFNSMAGAVREKSRALKEHSENLEAEVARRTAELVRTIEELRESQAKVKTLKGLIPICASCKNIRDDQGYWKRIEQYVMDHSEADFTHGICPQCAARLYE